MHIIFEGGVFSVKNAMGETKPGVVFSNQYWSIN
jgi:hypothetical protein